MKILSYKFFVSILAFMAVGILNAYDNISLKGTIDFKKQVKKPSAVMCLDNGQVVVSDAGHHVLALFSPKGKLVAKWGKKGKGHSQLMVPKGMDTDAEGRLYVADSGNNRIQVISRKGKFIRSIGTKGNGAGQLSSPSGVAVSHDGYVFVADTGNHRVQVFSKEGIYFHGFGKLGEEKAQLKSPTDVAISPEGKIYVLDTGNDRVQVFTPHGKHVSVIKKPLSGKAKKSKGMGLAKRRRMAGFSLDDFGYLYVVNESEFKVDEFDAQGKFVASFGTAGKGPGQFKRLGGVSAGVKNEVIVLDDALLRVQIFTLENGDKTQEAAVSPTMRLFVEPLPSVPLAADDLAFLGKALVGVSKKNHQIFLSQDSGKGKSKELGGKGKTKNKLNMPAGVTARKGILYVVDKGNRRVLKWDDQGNPVGVGQIGRAGKREGQFKMPESVAIDAKGRIYVTDSVMARYQVFSQDGIFLSARGKKGIKKGQFRKPTAIVMLPQGPVVLDAERNAVLFFDMKGKFLSEVSDGFVRPVSLASDPLGKKNFVYVLDAGSGQVKILSSKGQSVAAFGSLNFFTSPKAIAMDDTGKLWVSDGGNIKIFKVALRPRRPREFKAAPQEGQISLSWALDKEDLAASYCLYRSTYEAVSTDVFQVIPSTHSSYTDMEIVPGLTYYYALAPQAQGISSQADLKGPRALAQAKTARPKNLPPMDIPSISLNNVFSAQYKYYTNNPVGKLVIKNNSEKLFQQVRVGFKLQDFMDYPTETVIKRMGPGARKEIDLKATFNNKILSMSEDTPIQAQLTVTYYLEGEEKDFKRSQPFTLYSRNAMSWQDTRRLATFVTPRDPVIMEFARAALGEFHQDIDKPPLNPAISRALILFNALGEYGLSYQKDPTNPYEKAVKNTEAIDYIQYPRETLKRKSGDCDDLVSLYASLLESMTIPANVLDVPGHVLLMFQVDDSYALELGLPEDKIVQYQEAVWIPVEVTLMGRSFYKAWESGARAYHQAAAYQKAKIIDIHEAWAVYAPASLPDVSLKLKAPGKEMILERTSKDTEKVLEKRLSYLSGHYKARLKKNEKDEEAQLQLGIVYAEHSQWEESAGCFDKLLALNPKSASAMNNRANVHWMKDEKEQAFALYQKAAEADSADGGIQINLARAAWAKGDKKTAKAAYKKALKLQPELKETYVSLDDVVK